MKFFKVIDENVAKLMADYFAQYQAAFDAMLKFSRANGGDKKNLGIAQGITGFDASIIFNSEPDRNIWKMTRDKSGKFWVPKATKAAAEISKEFAKLNKSFPSKWDIYKSLNYEPFNNGFANFAGYNGTYVIGMRDEFKPSKKQVNQLERISDIEYEALLKQSVS